MAGLVIKANLWSTSSASTSRRSTVRRDDFRKPVQHPGEPVHRELRGDGIDVTGPLNQIGGPSSAGPTTAALGGNLSSPATRGFGIFLNGTNASGNLIENNSVGTTQWGGSAEGNGLWGIELYDAPDNVIGGIDQFSKGISGNYGNVISGNAQGGLEIQGVYSTHETVQGNEIGTDLTGTVRIANAASGIYIGNWGAAGNGPSDVTIGGTAAGARNVISGNGNFGIWMSGVVSSVLVQGNFIGTQASGNVAMANVANGIQLDSGAVSNTIGGTVAGASTTVASGNGGRGVVLTGSGTARNLIAGNIIGANVSGESALPNADWGVLLGDAGPGNTVGGASYSEGVNLISGNHQGGVAIYGAHAVGDVVEGNRIGTDTTGTRALWNARSGVYVGNWGTAGDAASDTTIAGNLISANGSSGVWITGGARNTLVVGNIIGTNVTQTAGLGNAYFGVLMDFGASSNTIGGTSASAGNVIAGNGTASTSQAFYGNVAMVGAGTSRNLVEGNDIGTNVGSATTLNPADSIGLGIVGGAADNTIGGSTTGAGNVISGNASHGRRYRRPGNLGQLARGERHRGECGGRAGRDQRLRRHHRVRGRVSEYDRQSLGRRPKHHLRQRDQHGRRRARISRRDAHGSRDLGEPRRGELHRHGCRGDDGDRQLRQRGRRRGWSR